MKEIPISELNRLLRIKHLLIILSLNITLAFAENVEVTARGRKALQNIVGDAITDTSSSSKLCLFENDVNSWCFT